jgi:hypothetical protein
VNLLVVETIIFWTKLPSSGGLLARSPPRPRASPRSCAASYSSASLRFACVSTSRASACPLNGYIRRRTRHSLCCRKRRQNYAGHPDVNPDGTVPENAVVPKLKVTASEELPAKFTTGPALAPPPTAPLMVAPPVFVAGLAVPLPFQLPDDAIRNHIEIPSYLVS